MLYIVVVERNFSDGVECIPLGHPSTIVVMMAAAVVKSVSANTNTCPGMARDGPVGTEPDSQMGHPLPWRKNPCN